MLRDAAGKVLRRIGLANSKDHVGRLHLSLPLSGIRISKDKTEGGLKGLNRLKRDQKDLASHIGRRMRSNPHQPVLCRVTYTIRVWERRCYWNVVIS